MNQYGINDAGSLAFSQCHKFYALKFASNLINTLNGLIKNDGPLTKLGINFNYLAGIFFIPFVRGGFLSR